MVILYALWNYAGMAKRPAKPGIGARLDAMLARVKPADLSERGWLLAADVNTSFFTDLRKGTVPSIDKVERLARVAGLSLAEFFSETRQTGAISEAQLQSAIADAFPLPPVPTEQQAQYLAEVVLGILGLPPDQRTSPTMSENGAAAGSAKGAPPRASTKRA